MRHTHNPVRVLYLSYDGVLEPLGESQIVRYMEKLKDEVEYFLISFEKPHLWRGKALRGRMQLHLKNIGVHWFPLRYHHRPTLLATFWDLFRGFWIALWLIRKYRIQIIHARSYVMGTLAWWLSRATGVPWIFDIRGFWVDERVDAGLLSRDSILYRLLKASERKLFQRSHAVVSLTQKALDILHTFVWYPRSKPERMIPTCVDLVRFQPKTKVANSEKLVLGYIGTTGGWYLFEPVLRLVRLLKEKHGNVFFWVVTRDDPTPLWNAIQRSEIEESHVQIEARPFKEVPEIIQTFDVSAFFLKPAFSKQASAPTRFAELMASGVPVVTNAGYGDLEHLIPAYRVGVVVRDFSDAALQRAANELLDLLKDPQLSQRCRSLAEERFSVEAGAKEYLSLYRELMNR